MIAVDLITFAFVFFTLFFSYGFSRAGRPHKGRKAVCGVPSAACMAQKEPLDTFLDLIFCLHQFSCARIRCCPFRHGAVQAERGRRPWAPSTHASAFADSVPVTLLPVPKSRVRAIFLALLLSMSSENFLLAFGNTADWRSMLLAVLGVWGAFVCLIFNFILQKYK